MKEYIENKTFTKIDFLKEKLSKGEYESCAFVDCSFSQASLSEINFAECTFDNCDFSMAEILGTAFRDARFKNCKLLGLHFEDCNKFLFSAQFEDCILNLSSFYGLNLKSTLFINCSLQETDFTESNLTQVKFDNCDLKHATFEHSILEKADFRTAYNYTFDLELNRIKKAKFSKNGVLGLLDKYDIEILTFNMDRK